MAYSSRGRKPFERASKIAHAEIIRNPEIEAYIKNCDLPEAPPSGYLAPRMTLLPAHVDTSQLRAVVAVDGGMTETHVRDDFPSATITFFTFGPLLFQLADLRALDKQEFIAPEDLAILKKIERYSLTLPTRGIRMKGESSLSSTIRRTIYEFFAKSRGDEGSLLDTLAWFLFRRWEPKPDDAREEVVEHCPARCGATGITFRFGDPMRVPCAKCSAQIYFTDVFRFQERVDEEQGAGAIASYVLTTLEQFALLHVIRTVLGIKKNLISEIFFIKDGPLAFFGLVAPLCRPMRELTHFLLAPNPRLHLVGIEKSGAFVEHAAAIQKELPPGNYMMLPDDYIYRYIVPGGASDDGYGVNTYYGRKVIYRARSGEVYVVTVPGINYDAEPRLGDFPTLEKALSLLGELRCSMYDNALVPVALANKLVSLSDFPSQRILQTFVRSEVK